MSFTVPAFSGQSYLRMRELRNCKKDLRIELRFKTLNDDAILLFATDELEKPDDFVSPAVVDGFVEFRCKTTIHVTFQTDNLHVINRYYLHVSYNLGSGPITVRSLAQIELNEFHTVIAKRHARDGVLQVDDGPEVVGLASGTMSSLDVSSDLFLGFVPNVTSA